MMSPSIEYWNISSLQLSNVLNIEDIVKESKKISNWIPKVVALVMSFFIKIDFPDFL